MLYIGNYKDGTGWGNAAAHNILALHSAGVDVVPRAITFEEKQTESPEISALEKKPATNIDVCIQHTLPLYILIIPLLKMLPYTKLKPTALMIRYGISI